MDGTRGTGGSCDASKDVFRLRVEDEGECIERAVNEDEREFDVKDDIVTSVDAVLEEVEETDCLLDRIRGVFAKSLQ